MSRENVEIVRRCVVAQQGATVVTLREGLVGSVRVSVDRARMVAETGLAPAMLDASGSR